MIDLAVFIVGRLQKLVHFCECSLIGKTIAGEYSHAFFLPATHPPINCNLENSDIWKWNTHLQ